jgi:hypothetical protein
MEAASHTASQWSIGTTEMTSQARRIAQTISHILRLLSNGEIGALRIDSHVASVNRRLVRAGI